MCGVGVCVCWEVNGLVCWVGRVGRWGVGAFVFQIKVDGRGVVVGAHLYVYIMCFTCPAMMGAMEESCPKSG